MAQEPEIEKEEIEREIGKIEGLSFQAGLERVYGQWDVYKKSLKLTISEIEKCDINLNKFLEKRDMRNFSIEVHGMKGLLANIGALKLSALALELENAGNREDAAFCGSALPPFLKALKIFGKSLEEVFAKENKNSDPLVIPPELPLVFDKLEAAFKADDFLAIDKVMDNLDALNSGGALNDEIDKIKDAVMMMNYEEALIIMRNLRELAKKQ